jgi:uncharacterized protein (DUF2062 family)
MNISALQRKRRVSDFFMAETVTGHDLSPDVCEEIEGIAHPQPDRLSFSLAVIVPTYNNGRTLADILARLGRLALSVIVVNDGSMDETAHILAEWQNSARTATASRTVVIHSTNCGKAAALQKGFAVAMVAGHTHAATIDSDGQLDPEQIPDLVAVAIDCPEALVIGVRDSGRSDYPARSRLGRKLSNFLIWLECDHRVEDSQCGLRIYPLSMVSTVGCQARRYGYETEIITRAIWSGWKIREVPVRCRYFPHGERVSHFRPWLDSARSAAMHMRLLLVSQMKIGTRPAMNDGMASTSCTLTAKGHLIALWHSLRRDGQSSRRLALSLACGVFIANQPVYGLQTVLSAVSARLFKLNPMAAVLGSFISTPPFGFSLIAMAIATGHLLLHGSMPSGMDFDAIHRGLGAVARGTLLDWVVGAPIVGGLLSACTFFAVTGLARFSRPGLSSSSHTAGGKTCRTERSGLRNE